MRLIDADALKGTMAEFLEGMKPIIEKMCDEKDMDKISEVRHLISAVNTVNEMIDDMPTHSNIIVHQNGNNCTSIEHVGTLNM